MKTKSMIMTLLVSVMALGSCDKTDEPRNPADSVSEQAKAALLAKYPDASNIRWQIKRGYAVANFTLPAGTRAGEGTGEGEGGGVTGGNDLSAWFDNGGEWYMTESNIPFESLPEAVQTAFNASEYAAEPWTKSGVDKLERTGVDVEVVYVIKVGNSDASGAKTGMDLYYSTDGVLIKKIADSGSDNDYGDYIPSKPTGSIEEQVRQKYPNARITDIDYEKGMTEVEILDGRTPRELLFDGSGAWQYTKTEVSERDVPEAVSAALAASEYKAYWIDDIDHYETSEGEFYRYDLESKNGDVKVDIALDGTLTVVQPGSGKPGQGNGAMVSAEISEFIATKYPGAKIVEYDYDDGLLEVEIWHENREKDVYFNGRNAWVCTEWDIRPSELPKAVTDAIAASEWASFEIDDIEQVQTPQGDYYLVELERGKQEVELRIKADGTIL